MNFEYTTLTKIQGIPTYEPLQKIKNEMKANAASVPCDLGGGNNCLLSLMLTVPEYVNVPPTSYPTVTSRNFEHSTEHNQLRGYRTYV